MITAGKSTWTDRQETLELVDKIDSTHGKDSIRPMCDTHVGGCGEITQYMVSPSSYAGKIGIWWVGLLKTVATYRIDPYFYTPVRICHKCAARKDGLRVGYTDPAGKAAHLAHLPGAALTPEEKEEFKRAFEFGFKSGCHKRETEAQEGVGKEKRYRERR